MNERIRELAIECATNLDWDNPSVDPNEFCYNKQALEKFAELIVRECGVALSPMLRDMVSRGQAYDLIRKHFGVEQ